LPGTNAHSVETQFASAEHVEPKAPSVHCPELLPAPTAQRLDTQSAFSAQ
jgi:hypothetical protein